MLGVVNRSIHHPFLFAMGLTGGERREVNNLFGAASTCFEIGISNI